MRISLLFGSIAVAFALFLVPVLSRSGFEMSTDGGVDRMITGSIKPQTTEYTLRRSVLQKNPAAFCTIRDGVSINDC